MQHRRSKTLLAVSVAAGLALAACGSDDKTTSTTAAPTTAAAAVTTAAATETTEATEETAAETTAPEETTAETTEETTEGSTDETTEETTDGTGATGTGVLAGVCPDTVSIQTDWNPEAEHGFLYQMVGAGYTVNKDKTSVTGPLMANGADTGVKIEVRSGGPAIGFQTVTSQLYTDDSILLGYVYTDEGIQNSAKFPTVAIESGFDKNPQMIMWDPATYPDVKTIADLGTKGVKIRYFGGAAYMDYFTSSGILKADQVDGSYDGTPALFIADEGKSAQQGFGAAEP